LLLKIRVVERSQRFGGQLVNKTGGSLLKGGWGPLMHLVNELCILRQRVLMAKKEKGKKISYCADPEKHVLVKKREGVHHWRKKRLRGELNESFVPKLIYQRSQAPAAQADS
jgi:hypothetical protein